MKLSVSASLKVGNNSMSLAPVTQCATLTEAIGKHDALRQQFGSMAGARVTLRAVPDEGDGITEEMLRDAVVKKGKALYGPFTSAFGKGKVSYLVGQPEGERGHATLE